MYSPTRRIGVSKLATVSECLTSQGTHVALKHYDKSALSPFQRDKIFAGAERWRTLSSPSLLSYLEVLPSENQIVMELMDRSAATRLSEGYSDPRLVTIILREMLTALAYIHEQGLLHVNLKPTNVFFDEAGRVKLSDGLLIPSQNPGTLAPPTLQKYLTPEHTSDAFGPMSFATDLYVAGFLALELLAGERFDRAFQGIGDDTLADDLAWFQWHGSSQEAPSAAQFCKSCPAQLQAVIARLTQKNPAERYPSAAAAIADLPADSPQASTPPNKASVQTTEVKRTAAVSDVLERPSTGVVLAIASGPRAGEMFGTNDTEFFIGFHPDCMLRFSVDQYPSPSAKVMCRRGAEGWIVSRVIGDSTFINQRLLEDKLVLRSGDIIRLSANGPDVQFTLQSGGLAVKSLASRFLPAQAAAGPATQTGPARPDAATRAPSPPAFNAPAPAAPRRPGSPIEARPVPAAPAPPRRDAVAAVAPAPPKPAASPSPQRPVTAPTPAGATAAISSSSSANGSWLDPKSWSKNQKNTAIAVIGGIFVVILVILIPTSPSKPPEDTEKPKDPVEQKESGDATQSELKTDTAQQPTDGAADTPEKQTTESAPKEDSTSETSN